MTQVPRKIVSDITTAALMRILSVEYENAEDGMA
jgi:hypothetical protein